MYAIASRFRLDTEADIAVSFTTTVRLPSLTNLPDDFDYVPAQACHKLVVFHAEYRIEIETIIGSVPITLDCDVCSSGGMFLRSWIRGSW